VLTLDTAELLSVHGDDAQLAPYSTGSIHVPTAPMRGVDGFVPIDDYPHAEWRGKRGRDHDAVVELTLLRSVPDIAQFITVVQTWQDGTLIADVYRRKLS
jgi:hypothetical protein